MHGIKSYQSTMDKTTRMNTVTPTIENGFVHLPENAAWRAEYRHELALFPKSKYDDQAASTSQALYWMKHNYLMSKLWIETIQGTPFISSLARGSVDSWPWPT